MQGLAADRLALPVVGEFGREQVVRVRFGRGIRGSDDFERPLLTWESAATPCTKGLSARSAAHKVGRLRKFQAEEIDSRVREGRVAPGAKKNNRTGA
jgi:hypothetical protein